MIGLLPGLDEEGSEFFDRVLNILDNLRKNVDETFFFQCMWLILITSSHHRGPALHYLGRRMPMLTNTEGTVSYIEVELRIVRLADYKPS